MRLNRFERPITFILVVFLAFLTGCGKKKGTVTGKVTFEGKPLAFGSVILATDDNQPFLSGIEPDGTYAIKDVPFGTLRVAVSSPKPRLDRTASNKTLTPEMKGILKLPAQPGPSAPEGIDVTKWVEIPERYASHDSSGITLMLQQKDALFDIPLQQ